MGWRSIFVSMAICVVSYGSCGLLTTSIGLNGSLTALVDQKGTISYLQDGYSTEGSRRVPEFTRVSRQISLGNIGNLKTVSSIVDDKSTDGYFAVVDTKGNLRLSVGNGRVIPIILPRSAEASSAMLYRTPLRDYQQTILAIRGLQEDPRAPKGSIISNYTKTAINQLPDYLYILAENRILRSTIVRHDFGNMKSKIQKVLVTGKMVRVRETITPPGIPEQQTIEPMVEYLVDFSNLRSDEKVVFLTNGTKPGEVLEFLPATSVGEEIPRTVDFMQVLSNDRIVLASETGSVFVINPRTSQLVERLKFPQNNPDPTKTNVWITSLSAHLVGDQIHIWAVDAISKGIYHWESTSPSKRFVLNEEQLPAGIHPKQIVSTGQLIPVGFEPKTRSTEGFYSEISTGKHEAEIERVLVIAEDESIHALVSYPDGVFFGSRAPRNWVSYPF